MDELDSGKVSTGIAAQDTIKEDLVDGEFCVHNDNTAEDDAQM